MSTLTVGDIENILFQAFPASWATPDDRFGLFVGDRNRTITKIAIALDSTVPMIETAAAKGCNILVTHHPPFWFAPMRF
ncbi:MAG: Nif3-like dinuclear metal center hexameric protein, partial [Coriobacteriales bacterium]|nr:Nif3-like dinuclear metal center hexameric protein [Coriobacteriales bacterium]